MANALPTGPRGRALALGVTILIILGSWILVVAPVTRFYSQRAERLEERAAIALRMERLAGQRSSLEARAAKLDAVGSGSRLLDGRSDAVAAAALQNMIQDIAATAGASLTSVASLPAEPSGGSRRIGIRLALSSSWPVLIRFLDATGQGGTPVLIDDLQIRSQALNAQGGQQIFDAGFNIYAFAEATVSSPQ